MGLKLSTMWNLFFTKQEVRIVLIGFDAAGKTTVLNRLKLGESLTTIPTIGFNVDTVEYKNLKFTMWDVGGQARLRPLWKHYYDGAHAIIFVVDSADKDRLADVTETLHFLLADEKLTDASLLVLANKQDMPGALPVGELNERLKLRQVRNRKVYIQGCTATTGNGLYEGLDWLSANLPKMAK